MQHKSVNNYKLAFLYQEKLKSELTFPTSRQVIFTLLDALAAFRISFLVFDQITSLKTQTRTNNAFSPSFR